MSMEYKAALAEWKRTGGARPHQTPDGILTRFDRNWFTAAELALFNAILEVQILGSSPALTDALSLLGKALTRVADHVERDQWPATKADANYTLQGTEQEYCEVCRHYEPPNASCAEAKCCRVIGRAVPRGWCSFFARKAA